MRTDFRFAAERRTKVLFSRLFKLVGGKFSRWIKTREARDPEAVYESAISDRVNRYHQLKAAAAGVIYMRNKLERELREKLAEMTEVDEEAEQAALLNAVQCEMIPIQRKPVLAAA